MKLSITLLFSLAATSVIGTLIPQNSEPEAYRRAFGEYLYRFFDALAFFDMYHSWWFQALLGLLTINIVVCSIERLTSTAKIIFDRNPSVKVEQFRKRKNKAQFSVTKQPADLERAYMPILSKRFGYVRSGSTDTGRYLYAEKGRLSRLGVYVVHLSIILLLLGGMVGAFWGFEGFVNIPEGETVDTIRLRNSNETRKLGFAVRCDDFDLSFYENGMPNEYRSSLVVIENNSEVLRKDIIVNDPLRYKGINFFQSSYGKMPNPAPPVETAAVAPGEDIVLHLSSKASGMAYHETVRIGEPVDIPEGLGKFVIIELAQTAEFRGMDIGASYRGILSPPDGESVEILLPLKFANFDKMRGGDVVISVESSAKQQMPSKGADEIFYTGLQVTRDPGVWIVYAGFIFMISGCFVVFFLSHQQVCVELIDQGSKSRVIVSGKANKNRMAIQRKVAGLSETLQETGTDDSPEDGVT